MATIPFNKPYMTGKELWYIAQAHAYGQLAGLFEDAQRGKMLTIQEARYGSGNSNP